MLIQLEKLELLYNATADKMPYFKKNTYEQAFRKYYGECLSIYDEIDGLVKDKSEEETDRILTEISSDFTSIFKKEYDEIKWPGRRRTYLTNHNSPLVIYTFPGILEYKGTWSKPLCDHIVKCWNTTFKNLNIAYGTFEDIKSGFKTTIFGFNLNKS